MTHKQYTVHSHNGILFSPKKRESEVLTQLQSDGPWKRYVQWKKPDTKGQILHETSKIGKSTQTESRLVIVRGVSPLGRSHGFLANVGAGTKLQCRTNMLMGFPGGSVVKNSPAGDTGSIPGLGRSPGEGHGYPLQYSWLKNPTDRGAWWATIHRVTKSWAPLKWCSTKDIEIERFSVKVILIRVVRASFIEMILEKKQVSRYLEEKQVGRRKRLC